MKIYCSHVWVTYVADPKGKMGVRYDFCHRCRTTYPWGCGLLKPEVEIGHTIVKDKNES